MAAAQEIGTPGAQEAPSAYITPNYQRTLVRIPSAQARDLHWYFGETLIAGIAIASDMGAMLERAEIYAVHLAPCKRCGGSVKDDRPGTGWSAKHGSYAKALRDWHRDLAKEKGFMLFENQEALDKWRGFFDLLNDAGSKGPALVLRAQLDTELPPGKTKRCQRCAGSGMILRRRNTRAGEITANPTGSSAHGNPDAMHAIDDQGLQRWGKVNRWLGSVCEESPLARVALGMYYSPTGGSIGALWELTNTGEAFLASEPNPLGLQPERLMLNARDTQVSEPTAARAAMLSRLARECAEVWEHACAVFVRLNPEQPE